MSNTTTPNKEQADTTVKETESGFFGRIFKKLDNAIKQKAEDKSRQCCCCSGESSDSNDTNDSKCC